jgi:hypothetical protein
MRDGIAGQASGTPLYDLDDAVRMFERIGDRHGCLRTFA